MGMKNRFQEAIQNVQRQRHLARRSVAMVLVLAMLTAMSVSWRLHQDGIALAADDTRYYCGKEEHKHTDDCYIEGTEPICGYEEGEIVEETMDSADGAGDGDSSAADWDEAGSEPESEPATQEEPEPEVVLHHHTADCYEEEEVLTCGIESDHVHQDYCYDQETGELLCTEHEHTDDCYTLEEVLVCDQEEGEPEETDDGAALYDRDENSAEESDSAEESETVADPEPEQEATKPQTDDEIDTGYTVHHHTAECYGKVLICGKEEHEHTADCLVNPNAEIDAEYDAKTPDRTSVDWAQDMVLVAQSQLGYTESKADVDEDGNGYTMYADQYYKDKPMVYADWDSTFVAYCLYHAGVPQDIIPQYASISALRGELARMNSEYYTDDPQEFASILPGDIVMYKNAEGRETIGVVSDAAVDEETDLTTALTVISGDVATGCESDGETTIDQVAEVEVALNEVTSFVSVNAAEGYGISDLMDEDPDAATASETEQKLDDVTNITSVTVSEHKDGAWTPIDKDHVITFGDNIRTQVDFTTDSSTFKNGKTLTYQLPYGMEESKSGRIMAQDPGNPGSEIDIGAVTVDDNGLVKLVFDFKNAPNMENEPLNAYFKVDSVASKKANQNSGEVSFPGTGTTIKLQNPTDIQTKKSGSEIKLDANGNKYVEFTVTVSSTLGTDGNKVKISDIIGTNTTIAGDYDENSFSLKKGDVSVELKKGTNLKFATDSTTGKPCFEISELDALEAGESYTLTYHYKLNDADTWPTGAIGNTASAIYEGKKDPVSVPWSKRYSGSLIEKSGNYDTVNRKMRWRIKINNVGPSDLNGYTVKDTLQYTGATIVGGTDGIKVKYGSSGDNWDSINKTVSSKGTVTITKNESEQETGFTYTFPAGSTEKYYLIEYYTTVPDGIQDNELLKNNAEIDKGDKKQDGTTGSGKVVRQGWEAVKRKANSDLQNGDADNQKIAYWKATAKSPESANSITLCDRFFDPVNSSGQTPSDAENTHYALLGELDQDLKKGIRIFRVGDTWTYGLTVEQAKNKGIETEIIYYNSVDQMGDNKVENTPENQNVKIRSFKIIVKEGEDYSGNKLRQINVNDYRTHVDCYDVMSGGETWTIQNNLVVEDKEDNASYTITKEKPVEKEESFDKMVATESNLHYFQDSLGSGKIGYNESGDTTFWYKLWISPKDLSVFDGTVITDELQEGIEYTGEYVITFSDDRTAGVGDGQQIAAYHKDWKWNKPNPNHVQIQYTNNKLTFTLSNLTSIVKDNKDYSAVAIMFHVKLADQEKWNADASMNENTYKNTVVWNGHEDDVDVTVERNKSYLEKTGKQLKKSEDQYLEEVFYQVKINPDGKDLIRTADQITLKDTFTTSQGATAVLQDVHLYKGDGTILADEDIRGLTTKTDESGSECKYTIELTVPDDQAYVFSYKYKIDTSNLTPQQKKNVKLNNKAKLFGKETKSNEIQYHAQDISAGAYSNGQLLLHKVQKNLESQDVAGAEFTLSKLDSSGWTICKNSLVTDQTGEIHFAKAAATESTNSAPVEYDTLYKLVEIKAPDGYLLKENTSYFIMLQPGQTELNAYQAATQNAGSATLPKQEDVTFATYGKTTVLQVENSKLELTVRKVWKNADGTIMSEDQKNKQNEIKVDVFKKGDNTAFDTVTLNSNNGWTAQVNLAKCGNLKSNTKFEAKEQDGNNYIISYMDGFGVEHSANDAYQSGDTIVVVNQLKPTELSVVKKWNGQDGSVLPSDKEPDSIQLKLFKVESTGGKTLVQVDGNDTVTMTKTRSWKYTFTNLDPTAHYVVEEASVSGYTVSYSYPEGSSGTTGVAPGGTVTITNTEAPTYELPSTGSPGGTVPYTAGGAAIALAAVLCGYNSRRKRKRGEE